MFFIYFIFFATHKADWLVLYINGIRFYGFISLEYRYIFTNGMQWGTGTATQFRGLLFCHMFWQQAVFQK